MHDYLLFWTAKALVEIGIALAVLLLAAMLLLPGVIRQARCQHEKFRETSACDAVCVRCGKNLGFIGTVRKARAKEQS